MKKIIILFLCLALILLCSCDSASIDSGNTVSEILGNISSDNCESDVLNDNSNDNTSSAVDSDDQDKTAVIKTEKQVYTTDVKTIVFQIYNNDTDECSFATDGYKLEIKKGNKWAEVPYKNNIMYFELLAVIIGPSESWKTELNLDELYHLPLEKGVYRIGNENGIDGIDSLEFEIK